MQFSSVQERIHKPYASVQHREVGLCRLEAHAHRSRSSAAKVKQAWRDVALLAAAPRWFDKDA